MTDKTITTKLILIIAFAVFGVVGGIAIGKGYDCEYHRGGAFVRTAFWFTCLPKNEGMLHVR